MMEQDVFGLPITKPEDDEVFSAPGQGTPEEPKAAAPPEGTPAEKPAEKPDTERLFAGKYRTIEDLERGYSELRDLQRRTAERAKVYEQQAGLFEQRALQLEQAFQRMMPYLNHWQQVARQTQAAEGYEEAPTPQLSPEQIQQMIDQQVSARVAAIAQAAAAREEADRDVKEATEALMQFYKAHPEIEIRGQLDGEIAQTIQDLNMSWDEKGYVLDIGNVESLEIAYEATKRPALKQVLSMHPEYVETDAGMELARFQASLLEGKAITQSTAEVPASEVQGLTQKKPFSEAASGANPAGPEKPLDEFEQAVLEYRKQSARGGNSIFFS